MRASLAKSQLQTAIDSAVLAGVTSSTIEANQIAVAQRYFDKNGAGAVDEVSVSFTRDRKALIGTASGVMNTTLMRIVGVQTTPVTARAKATALISREPMCIMAMHPTRKHTLELKDSVSVIAPDCHIYGNSDHYNDVVDPHTPHNYLVGRSVAAVGGGHHYLVNVTPPVEFGHELIPDPLSHIPTPTGGSCLQTNYTVSGGTLTLPQGKYCGGLKIKSGADVTLEPGGTYYVSGGTFEIESSALTGDQVTIVLTDAAARLQWEDATVRLKAPITGPYAGLAVLGARVETENSFIESAIDIHGVFYMPKGDFTWTNKGTPPATAKWSAFVVDGFSWRGNGTINVNFDLASSDIPYPESMRVIPRPSLPRLLE